MRAGLVFLALAGATVFLRFWIFQKAQHQVEQYGGELSKRLGEELAREKFPHLAVRVGEGGKTGTLYWVFSSLESLEGEKFTIEVLPQEALVRRRVGFAAWIATALGFLLAVGAAIGTYLGTAKSATLKEESHKDELTGLRNRRAFNEMMEREIGIADRYGRPLSLLILDLDHFKEVNDTMGHAAGDQVLQIVADVIQRVVRETDVSFRHGGEEFAVILTETHLVPAVGLAERIRQEIAHTSFFTSAGKVKLTVSIGATSYRVGESVDEFLTRVDMALYRAKSEGRDRVVTERPTGWEA